MLSWEELSGETLTDFSDYEHQLLHDAYRTLQPLLTEAALDPRHAFRRSLYNRAEWTRRRIIDVASMIAAMQDCENVDALTSKLKFAQSFGEALSLLKLGYEFRQSALTVGFEPELRSFGMDKKPDLHLTNDDRSIDAYVEEATCYLSIPMRYAINTSEAFFDAVLRHGSGLVHAGELFRPLSGRHLHEVLTKIAETAQKAEDLQQLQVFDEPGVSRVAFAPESARPELVAWAAAFGLVADSLKGTEPKGNNEINRIKQKLREEREQLPPRRSNLVMLTSRHFWNDVNDSLPDALAELEEALFQYENVAILTVTGQIKGRQSVVEFGEHKALFTDTGMGHVGSLMILNRYADVPAAGALQAAVQRVLLATRNYFLPLTPERTGPEGTLAQRV